MKKIIIHGGKKLKGTVKISGSKNASLPILISTILIPDKVSLSNIPKVSDITMSMDLLINLGAKIDFKKSLKSTKTVFDINCGNISNFNAPKEIVSQFRASFWVLGPLLARFGECKVALPGGCAIGPRPVDIYIETMKQMSADVIPERGYVIAKAKYNKLKGADIKLRLPSVGATHNIIMAATLAEGTTRIFNAAKEPEVVDLSNFLISAGAKIKGAGTDVIEIEGVESLNKSKYTVMSDRIEAFSYMVAAVITNSTLTLTGLRFKDVLTEPLRILKRIGVEIEYLDEETIKIKSSKKKLGGYNITTDFYPGFPTDCQPIIMPLLTFINDKSSLNETIYENRFNHVLELNKMGADIYIDHNIAYINGGTRHILGTDVVASDLRAGMCLVLAGLAAAGETTILNVHHIERGYENLIEKLKLLGADIKIIEVENDERNIDLNRNTIIENSQ